MCGNYSSETEYGNAFQYADPGAVFPGQKTSGVFTLAQPVFGIFGMLAPLQYLVVIDLWCAMGLLSVFVTV